MKAIVKKILIVGGGNMGYAIADGLAQKRIFPKNRILFFEKNPQRITFLKSKKYIADNNKSIITKNKNALEAIILAVKPGDLSEAAFILKKTIERNTPVISIIAGKKIKTLEQLFNNKQPIIRAMPNTPCQTGKGISALTYNKQVNQKTIILVREIFNSTGKFVEIPEKAFDLVTALSGSGPAYFCYFIESMTSAGERLGLNKKLSYELVFHTAVGTLSLIEKQDLKPETLRQNVTSPKGTTEAALKVFKKRSLDKIIFAGIKAAKERAGELGKSNG